MPNNCRACGGLVNPPTEMILEALAVTELPEFCRDLCRDCLWQCTRSDEAAVTEDDVTKFLARKTNQIAARVGAGMNIIRCMALRQTIYGDWDQCGYFGNHEHRDGHRICHWCRKRGEKELLRFVGDGWNPPRRFEIFASSPEELMDEARKRADAWGVK